MVEMSPFLLNFASKSPHRSVVIGYGPLWDGPCSNGFLMSLIRHLLKDLPHPFELTPSTPCDVFIV